MNLHAIPTLLVHPRAWRKILTYVQLSPVEINGWAFVRMLTPALLYVGDGDVFITKQTVSGGSADIDGSTVALALYHAQQAGRAEEMRLQWHSHVDGAPIFSATDTATMDAYGNAGATWMVSVVLNKAGRATARLDLYSPLRASVDMRILLEQQEDNRLLEDCAEDILAVVDLRTFGTTPGAKGRPSLRTQTNRPMEETDLRFGDVRATHIPVLGPA